MTEEILKASKLSSRKYLKIITKQTLESVLRTEKCCNVSPNKLYERQLKKKQSGFFGLQKNLGEIM